MSPSISIIIPVYNAESYLSRCLQSIINQTFQDFEVLLIDDGSTDRSPIICDDYEELDDRIKAYHKKNGGVASARQYGLEHASGEYSIHVDPDDWIEATALEDLITLADVSKSDIVICDFYLEIGKNKKKYVSQDIKIWDNPNILHSLLNGKLHGSLWNKLIRTRCYHQLNVAFNLQMTYLEDLITCCSFAIKNASFSYLPKALYHYDLYSNSNSLIRNVSINGLHSLQHFISFLTANLSNQEENFLYLYKSKAREYAFKLGWSADSIKSLYPEIEDRYKNDWSKRPIRLITRFALYGNFKLGKVMFSMYKLMHHR